MKTKPILIWDWDGTLVDSLSYKYDSIWDEVFVDELEKINIVKSFINTKEGKTLNRYGLIKYTLLNTGLREIAELSDEVFKEHPLVTQYANRYDHASKKQITKNNFLFPRVKDTLQRLHATGYSMYIISGGGTDESLKSMADTLDIRKYFRDIFGFGNISRLLTNFGKHENFNRMMKVEQEFDPSHYVVIGDGETDRQFAEDVECKFIGISSKWNKWLIDNNQIVSSVPDVERLVDSWQNQS